MKAYRTKPRTAEQIIDGIERIKAHGRPDLTAIHLIPCDMKKVADNPAQFNCTKQKDGTLRTVFLGRMIEVVAIE